MKPISTDNAPAAVGPYSQAMRHSDLLFVSGQLPIDPATGSFNSEEPVEQMQQCLRNIAAIAKAAGADLSHTIKTTILLTEMSGFAAINDAYGAFFSAPYPARATFEVSGLPRGAKVEVEAVIAIPSEA